MWLTEKEEALSEVQTSNFKDPSEMNTNVRRLAVSRLPSLCSWHAAAADTLTSNCLYSIIIRFSVVFDYYHLIL